MTALTDAPRGARLRELVTANPWLLTVALIGFSVSFQTIAHLAQAHGLPGDPRLYPVLIDVGIMSMVAESRRAIDDGRSDLVPRLLAWALIGLTLYVNAHGAAPHDWLGRALHVVAPALWAALLELTRWRRIARKRAEEHRDRIPLARWVLAPWRTAWLFRRMVLWGETSYARAVTRQAVVLYATAVAQADARIGSGPLWRRRLPVTLRWQLAEGKPSAEVEKALAAGGETWQAPAAAWVTGALRMLPRSVTPPAGDVPGAVPVTGTEPSPDLPEIAPEPVTSTTADPSRATPRAPSRRPAQVNPRTASRDDLKTLVRDYLADRPAASIGEIRRLLGCGQPKAKALLGEVRAESKPHLVPAVR